MTTSDDKSPRRIRSFVIRGGRMTEAQQRGFDASWQRWGIDYAPQQLDLDEAFGGSGEKVLEIGFGMGQSLLAMAAARPAAHYLGVEVHRAGVGKLLNDADREDVSNLRVICHDAVEVLENCILPDAFDRVQIFFPDPWHKKKHHKRRLIQAPFVELLVSRLKRGGVLHLATDWEPYAEHILEVLNATTQLSNLAPAGGFSERPEERPITKFEKRGQRLGHGVWDLLYERI